MGSHDVGPPMTEPVQSEELRRALEELPHGYRLVVDDALDALWETLRFLVAGDDEPCWFDHHGYCQGHHTGEIDGECATAYARRLVGLDVHEETP